MKIRTRKGVVLAMVLVVCFFMTAIALLLHSNTRDEMRIAGNSRRMGAYSIVHIDNLPPGGHI